MNNRERARVSVIVPARVDPVSLADVRLHCRIDDTTENSSLALMLRAAVAICENWMRRPIMTQTFRAYYDEWPLGAALDVPRSPLVSVSSIKTYSETDVASTFPAASYFVDTATTPGRVVLRGGYSWPSHSREGNPIEIEFRAGYGDDPAEIPAEIRQAVLATVAYLYEQRGDAGGEMPPTCEILLAGHREWW